MATVVRHPALLSRDETGLIVVDVQEAFRQAIDGFDAMARNVGILAAGFGVLGRPVLVSEQYPSGLGHTVQEVAERLPEGTEPIEKTRFSACGVAAFDEQLAATACSRWVVCGIEAHVCVNQTVHDLLARGYEVHVAEDAVSSRAPTNRRIGLEKMTTAGARATSAETALFEMLEEAGGGDFRAISKLVR
ncbi:MAG TPA: isochorismatase family protein [Miltoncostaeaceae bacterium]|nr:isochorismatase family protein [Miltoncostaeaceae bacterium]